MTDNTNTRSEQGFSAVLKELMASNGVAIADQPGIQELLKALGKRLAGELADCWSIAAKVDLNCDGDTSLADFLASAPDDVIGMLYANGWQAHVPVSLPRKSIALITAQALGSANSTSEELGERALSRVELHFAQRLVSLLGDILARHFEEMLPSDFITLFLKEPPLEEDLDDMDSKLLRIRCDLKTTAGETAFIFGVPATTLLALKDRIGQPVKDSPVDNRLLADVAIPDSIAAAELCLDAYLDGGKTTLKQISEIKAGTIFPLETTLQCLVPLRCGDYPVFMCRLGQHRGRFNVKVDSLADNPMEVVSELFSAYPGRQDLKETAPV